MTAVNFVMPFRPAFDSNSIPIAGAKVYFYQTGTTTLAPVFYDQALTIPAANPLIANSAGRFAQTFIDDTITYRVKIYYADGSPTAEDYDPYTPFSSAISEAAQVAAQASATAAAASATSAATSAATASTSITVSSAAAASAAASAASAGAYPNTAAANVPRGAVAFVLTPGSGGTNGTNIAATFSSGNYNGNPSILFDIVGGAVTNVRIITPGLYIGSSPTAPTVALPGGAGGAALTLTNGFLVSNGNGYWVQSADNRQLLHFLNVSGTATADNTVGPLPNTLYIGNKFSGLAGANTIQVPLVNKPYTGFYNQATFEITFISQSIADGSQVDYVGVPIGVFSGAMSGKVEWWERNLSAGDLNTTGQSSGETLLATTYYNSLSDLTAIGIAPGTNNPVTYVQFFAPASLVKRAGYAIAPHISFYSGTNQTGTKIQIYLGYNSATSVPASVLGFRKIDATTTSWTAIVDGLGVAFRFGKLVVNDTSTLASGVLGLQQFKAAVDQGVSTTTYIAAQNARTGFFPSSGVFYAWDWCVDQGSQVATNAPLTSLALRVAIPATSNTINLYAFRRLQSDPALNNAPDSTFRDRTPIAGFPVTLTTAGLGLSPDVEGPISFTLPAGVSLASGETIELQIESLDSGAARTKIGIASGAASASQHLRGWLRGSPTADFTAPGGLVSGGISYTLNSTEYVATSSGASVTQTYPRYAVTGMGVSSFTTTSVTISSAGSTISDGAGDSLSFGGTVSTIPAAASGKRRYDGIYVDTSTLSLIRIAGTERTADASEYLPVPTSGTYLEVGIACVSSSGLYDFIVTWDVTGVIRRSMLDDVRLWARDARKLLYPVLDRLYKGASVTVAGDGDSTLQMGTATATANTPNGADRDHATTQYLNTNIASDTITAANIPTYTDGSGTHDIFGPMAEFWRIRAANRFASTITISNFGVNGTTSAAGIVGSHTTAIIAALSATDPCVFHYRYGMNDIVATAPSATYSNIVSALATIKVGCPKVVPIVHGVARPNDSKTGYTYSMWLATHIAMENAARQAGAVFIPNWAGYQQHRGVLRISGTDRCTANMNTAGASNHPGIREQRYETAMLEMLFFSGE